MKNLEARDKVELDQTEANKRLNQEWINALTRLLVWLEHSVELCQAVVIMFLFILRSQ